jgi:serine/threonine protein kinase
MATIDRDMAVAQAATDLHFITPDQLDECVQIQKSMASMGIKDDLASIFMKKGYITQQQLKVIEQAFQSAPEPEPPAPAARAIPGAALPPGMKLPEIRGFEIQSILGKGGMGIVYGARQKSMDRFVALKVLSPELSKQRDYIDRFMNEAKSVARVSHKNIVMAYDVGESNGNYYLAMEYVEGRPLHRILKDKGKLEERQALRIAREVCEALAYLLDNKMIHRDIKPENIIVSSDGSPRILDLGLARSLQTQDSSLTMAGMTMGTPHYISPEQVMGQRDLDIRVDIYALGGTLYAMLTGKPPYQGETPAVVFAKHLHDPIPDPRTVNPSVSESTARIIARCMAKDRKERPSPRDLLAELDRALEVRQVTPAPKAARVPPARVLASSRVQPSSSGNPALWIGAIAAVVVVAAVVIFAAVPGKKIPQPPVTPPSPPVIVKPPPPPPRLDPAREEQATRCWEESQAHMKERRWEQAVPLLQRLSAELAETEFGQKIKPEVAKALEECRAGIEERLKEARSLELKAQGALGRRLWAEALELYTSLVNDYPSVSPEQRDAFRSAMAVCDRELKVETLVKEAQEAMAAENWDLAQEIIVKLNQTYPSSITLTHLRGEISQWEKSLRAEMTAAACLDVLRREIGERKWTEAEKMLGELSKHAATVTCRKRPKEIEELRLKIEAGLAADSQKIAETLLKEADAAYAGRRWGTAKEKYTQLQSRFASAPSVQPKLPEIARRIADCSHQLQLLMEQRALYAWVLSKSYFDRQEYSLALPVLERLETEFASTKVYRDRKSEIARRKAECLSKAPPEPPPDPPPER